MEQLSNQSKKKNPSKTIGIATCVILTLSGLSFGIYGLIEANNKSSEISDLKIQIEDKDGKITTLETDKIKVSDDSQTITISDSDSAYAIRDLKTKTLRLLGARNGLSVGDYLDNTDSFMVYSLYIPTDQLLSNNLDETAKAYMTLETTILDKEKSCNYKFTENIKADIDSMLAGTAVSGATIGDQDIDCISYDVAASDHYSLWGESLPKLNYSTTQTSIVSDFGYGQKTNNYYYHVFGGRGGAGSSYSLGKITQVNRNQDLAYVDIKAGTLIDNPEETTLYTEISGKEAFKTLDTTKKPDLTEDDYNHLQSYRFTFKKNSDGIYSFSSVEKL
ncbi:MAG: hypothetical protein Q4F60_00625 [Candidatus Saccharibacteria bacterium]|nr:hypothetical protein [Candidatus Saccharibacteria bacterium]